MELFKRFKSNKNRFTSKAMTDEVNSYSNWEMVSISVSGKDMFFYVQPNISSFEIDTIISEYGNFLKVYAVNIDEASNDDEDKMTAIKLIFGFLYAFLVRHKTDIVSGKDKVIKEKISGEEMFTFAMNIIKLNTFDSIVEKFNKDSIKILFDRFNDILNAVNKIEDLNEFAKKLDSELKNKPS